MPAVIDLESGAFPSSTDFWSWLEERSQVGVGVVGQSGACPLSGWLTALAGYQVIVALTTFHDETNDVWGQLPEWAHQFVRSLEWAFSSGQVVTGVQVLAVLDQTLRELAVGRDLIWS